MGFMFLQGFYFAAVHMIVVALAGLVVYRLIKLHTRRSRPYNDHPQVMLRAQPLDEFSFPSGHTLHAVSLTLVALYYYPVPDMWNETSSRPEICFSRDILACPCSEGCLAMDSCKRNQSLSASQIARPREAIVSNVWVIVFSNL